MHKNFENLQNFENLLAQGLYEAGTVAIEMAIKHNQKIVVWIDGEVVEADPARVVAERRK